MQNDPAPPPSLPSEYAETTFRDPRHLTNVLARYAIEMEVKAEVGYDGMAIKQEPEIHSFHLTDAAAAAASYFAISARDLEITVRGFEDFAFAPTARGQKRARDGTYIEQEKQANNTLPYFSFQNPSLLRSTSPHDSLLSCLEPAASYCPSPQQEAEDEDENDNQEKG